MKQHNNNNNDDVDNHDDDEDSSNDNIGATGNPRAMWKDRKGRPGGTMSDRERVIEQKCDDENAEA